MVHDGIKTDWPKQVYFFYTQLSAGSLLVLPSIMLPIYFHQTNIYAVEGYLFFIEFFGMLIGSLLLAGASDRIGRRPTLAISIILYSTGSFLPSLNGSLYSLSVSMLIMGTGIGANVPIVNALMNEHSAPSIRGIVMSLGNAIFNLGFIIIPIFLLIGAGKYVFSYGLIQLILLLPILRIPETTKMNSGGGFKKLYMGNYLKRTLTISFATFFVFFSVYGIIDWVPTLIYKGVVEAPAFFQNGYIIIANLGAFAGAALMAPFIERLGRKTLGILVNLLAGVAEIILGFISGNAFLLVAALIFSSVLFMEGGLAIVTIVSSELYDPEMRGRGLGNSLAWGRIGGMISPLVLGSMFEELKSPSLPFLVISISSLFAMICFFILPETRHVNA